MKLDPTKSYVPCLKNQHRPVWTSNWILKNVCSKSERSNYFAYIKKKTVIILFT